MDANTLALLDAEIAGVSTGVAAPAGTMAIPVHAICPRPAEVWNRIKSVIELVNAYRDDWPEESEWSALLPGWFVEACAPPPSKEEEARELAMIRSLSPEARAEYEKNARWELEGWLGWMEPDERPWFVVSHAERDRTLEIVLAVPDEPVLGAFLWLVRAAGGESVVVGG